jgi:hypothetical protein
MRAKFINESVNNIDGWHTSVNKVNKINNSPMWFAPSEELARVYYSNIELDQGQAYIYKASITGNILSNNELIKLSENLGIDYNDLMANLSSNPPEEEVNELTRVFRNKCDGFFMEDYDPRDPSKDIESILVFDPIKNVESFISLN